MARLLILTLSSGEAALPILIRQLAAQSFQDFEHEVISGLPNQAAHNCLYRTVMDRAASFDLFMKLDADMTLRSESSIAEAVRATDEHPDVQHFEFRLWDCFTEEETLGVHMFRSGVTWDEIRDDLFVDQAPKARTIMWEGPPAPFVNHGEFVSDFECFAFGVHKFLKTAQRDRTHPKRVKYLRHMRNCARIRDLYRETHARRHLLALAGIVWAMEHKSISAMSNKSELQGAFDAEMLEQEARWSARVDRLSRSVIAWRLALLRSLGPRRAFAAWKGARGRYTAGQSPYGL